MSGAVLQLASPWAVRRIGSHRRWVVVCAALQAASFLPLAAIALAGHLPVLPVFAVAAWYFGSGMGTSPAWSAWVDALVPPRIRPRYFARRTRVGQFATLAGFVVAGVSLQAGAWANNRLTVFATLFLIAGLCRAASTWLLASQSEPAAGIGDERRVSLAEFFRRCQSSAEGRLLFYFLAVQAAAQIAGPYFTSYMLGPMQFSYARYVTLIAVCFTAKALALPALGTLAERVGTQRLLWLGGLGIVPVASLWVISNTFAFLVGVQILSGVSWAAYELAVFLLFFETIRPDERTGMLTSFNFANAVATACGALLGGALLALGGKSQSTYWLLFALSSTARALALLVLVRASILRLQQRPFTGRRQADGPANDHSFGRSRHAPQGRCPRK